MSDPNQRAPIADSPLSVVLFGHALSTETPDALRAWRQYLDGLGRAGEILLIQETRPEAPAAEELPLNVEQMRVFPYDRAAGFRTALNDAIRAAQHPLLAFCTADKQYVPNDLDAMLKIIDKVDLVAGYRKGGRPPGWRVVFDMVLGLFSRVLIGVPLEPRTCWLGREGWGRRWIARWIFGVRVADPECPFRLVRRALFEHLPIQSGGPFVQVEILAKANHLSCLLTDEGVTWSPPVMPASDAITFGHDARLVFQQPDFGAYIAPAPTLASNGPSPSAQSEP